MFGLFDWMFPRTLDERMQDLYDRMGWGEYRNPNMNQQTQWVVVDDNNIRHLWECPDCDAKAEVHPWYYSERGEPFCSECECDMEYIRTEILANG